MWHMRISNRVSKTASPGHTRRPPFWDMLTAMQAQTLAAAPSPAAVSSRALFSSRAVLWAALLTYPFVPALLYQSGALASSNRVLAGAAVLLSYAWSIAGPVAAWF